MGRKKVLAFDSNPTPADMVNGAQGATNDHTNGPAKLNSPILQKLKPDQWSMVLAVEFYRKKFNDRGVFVKLDPVEFDGGDGEPQRQLTVWAELSREDLGNLLGRGEYRVCCRGAASPVCWITLELEGPDPEDLAPKGDTARARHQGPKVEPDAQSSSTTQSVSWAFGTLVDPTDLPPAMRPIWLLMQEHAVTEQMRYEDVIKRVSNDAEMRVRMSERFALATVQMCESRVKESQVFTERITEMLKNFTALQCEIQTANAGGGGGYSDGKFIARLYQDERAAVQSLAKRFELLKDKLRDAETKKKPAAADTVLAFRDLAAELRRTMKQFRVTWNGLDEDDEDEDDGATVEGNAEPAEAKAKAARSAAVEDLGPR